MKLMIASDLHGSAYYVEALLRRRAEEQPEKLLLLDGKTLSNGGSVAQSGVKRDKKKDKE